MGCAEQKYYTALFFFNGFLTSGSKKQVMQILA